MSYLGLNYRTHLESLTGFEFNSVMEIPPEAEVPNDTVKVSHP